jgi:hypothetical protein
MKIKLMLWALALVIISCNSDDEMEAPDSSFNHDVIVGNEGGFGNDNASLTAIDQGAMEAQQNVFTQKTGQPLGDVLHSLNSYNDEIYAVVNNSGKIEVLGKESLDLRRTIIDLESPRYIEFISESKAYVSDFVANGIHIIEPGSGNYSGFVDAGTWIEQMETINGEVWTTAPYRDKVYIIDPNSNSVSDSVAVAPGTNGLETDADGNAWVIAQGTYNPSVTEASLNKIDGDTKELVQSFQFPDGAGYGTALELSPDGTSVYFLLEGAVYKMALDANQLPSDPIISPAFAPYGLSVNSSSGHIALTDAVDYVQSGRVYFYDADGSAINDFPAGIAPKAVLWANN